MQNPYFFLLKTTWLYSRNERGRYVLVYSLSFIATLLMTMAPLLYGWFVNYLQTGGEGLLKHMWWYIGCYVGLHFLHWAFHGPARILERELAFNVCGNFLSEFFGKLLQLPIEWHQHHHSGATVNRLRKAYMALRVFLQNGFSYLYTFVNFTISFVAMVFFSPLYGSIATGIGLFTIWVIFKFDKPYTTSLHELNEGEHVLASKMSDNLSNIKTVITLRLEKRIHMGLLETIRVIFPTFMRTSVINEWKWFVANTLVCLIYCVMVIGYTVEHYQPGQIFEIGGFVALLGFVNQFTSVFYSIAYQYTEIIQHSTDVQSVSMIDESYRQHHRTESKYKLATNWSEIEISNLSFRYLTGTGMVTLSPSPSHKGLFDINLKFRRGSRVAFVGDSGSGKSTLMAILRGIYQPCADSALYIDRERAEEWTTLADAVTLIPQEPEIFDNTIAYNITLGLPFSDEEIRNACDIAQLTDVIEQLPDKMETRIHEKGVNLSGGQRQRLALARGVLASRGSSILLLDEPTSNLDFRKEGAVYQRFFEAFPDKLIICCLHNMNLIDLFDYTYVLSDGRIIEEGINTTYVQSKIASNVRK